MKKGSELFTAYRNAQYLVWGHPELRLQIGKPCPALGVDAAFLTAANPGSTPRSAGENEKALHELSLDLRGYALLPGESRAADGSWREPSLLVRGISREAAAALGRRYGQNAIVYIAKGGPAELVPLA